jgi:predicted dehydrogenase
MRFALLGDHPHGLDLALALIESGRHELVCYSGPAQGLAAFADCGSTVRPVADLEEVLADPAIETVIVASGPAVRAAQLRRALQSERHVVCVHPLDRTPDAAYEAAMIQNDTGRLLLPLLPEALHPAVAHLAGLVQAEHGPLGKFQLMEMERWAPGPLLIQTSVAADKPSIPGWEVVRAVAGEISEVYAFADREETVPGETLLLGGRLQGGGLFQVTLVPGREERRWWLAVLGSRGQAELVFPRGWPGPARLTWQDNGAAREEFWEPWNAGPALLQAFESALAGWSAQSQAGTDGTATNSQGKIARPTWQDAVRCLELDVAARRSVERRRTSPLEFQDATEEVGFKGTMTLAGCGLLWGMLLLVVLSRWFPALGWVIIPLLVVFLGLQLLRWLIPKQRLPSEPKA